MLSLENLGQISRKGSAAAILMGSKTRSTKKEYQPLSLDKVISAVGHRAIVRVNMSKPSLASQALSGFTTTFLDLCTSFSWAEIMARSTALPE